MAPAIDAQKRAWNFLSHDKHKGVGAPAREVPLSKSFSRAQSLEPLFLRARSFNVHDAVELSIQAVAGEVSADVGDQTKFDQLWEKIEEAPKSAGKRLTQRPAMLALNKARVGFKHYGNLPDKKQAFRHEVETSNFLADTFRTYFDLDFEKFSLVELIRDQEILATLKKAQEELERGDFLNSVSSCALAGNIVGERIESVLPKTKTAMESAVKGGGWDDDMAADAMKFLALRIDAVREFAVVTALGLPLADVLRSHGILPIVSRSPYGERKVQIQVPASQSDLRKEDVEFALKYVVDLALAVEERLLIQPHVPNA